MKDKQLLTFRGGYLMAYLPLVIFLGFCILFFVVLKAFEMHALAMGAILALLIGSIFVKPKQATAYWEAVYEGARESVPVLILLMTIGIFSQMIKTANLSAGFVYLAQVMGVEGGLYTAMTFLFVSIIATATGSSIGSFFTCFPIFYPAGVLLGAHPAALAGAILSGGVFGDNLAPISDTTIISAGSQHYRHSNQACDIGGVVRTRLPYALIAGALSFVFFLICGGGGSLHSGSEVLGAEHLPSLSMLIPVLLMIVISIRKRNLYLAILVGLLSGCLVGLLTGVLQVSDILSSQDGALTGFLTEGVEGMMGTCLLVLSVYGIMGVLNASGALHRLTNQIRQSKLCQTVAGTELAMMLGITLTTILFGGVSSASMTTFGKVQNELGQACQLHPYRRANLLDGFANGLGVAVPFLSVFIFVGSQLTQGYDLAPALSVTQIAPYLFHSYNLFLVLLISILTGWGRRYEGLEGEEVMEAELMDGSELSD
ncbi:MULTISPECIES: Na+/H+ antiporter NhaC family protein [Aerococcus]|uniref:Na+/H+ antiporter NhaC family protein n=1 Tax=Aerococcus sanguinicola TaxID=119206 RepID=A0A5N1GJF9_9LACT|nr:MULTISPECIES: Na+/H+ antiporter NhaC family protein [Aerococcus]KAA9300329.1 Na+/H+ antiporter NhaC family protein [Aerococcus sanguinicola]MDK6369868.1 Na+/H+ antiporter NhaC family protein [Aerococcus sp. UMB9870]MDK6678856.1 Na+/H+ antiporter NhaC family protein [Aerococcus sp. UMB8608]MDK6686826.1 Na+/H+ antiporter NhaC family protein [Aerococcus sp. UMB8623]MDK6939514.1 Na+/H+ antiporter NhaC family protein [Aerococcus sp. UMB8487]